MPVSMLCTLGHLADRGSILARGYTARALRDAVLVGEIVRLRAGIYACAHLSSEVTIAARLGGALTCVSILREAGVWAGHSRALHLQVPPTASGRRGTGLRLHWTEPRFPMESRWRVGRMQALWQAIHCLDEENAIAAMESAIHEQFLTRVEVAKVGAAAPARLSSGIAGLLPNSGSGNETIVRRRLERAGHQVVAQPFVPGLGHQDLLVDDCVGVDVDGRTWHGEDRFVIDRDRDLHAEGLGRHALRLTTSHIFDTWPHTLLVIDRAVADARRANSYRFGRTILSPDDPL